MIFRLFEKSQTHSICNFKKPCLLECQPKNVKSFQCKTRDKTLLCKSQYFFHKNMSQKEQLCAGKRKIYGPTDRVSGNDPFSFVTSWFEWKHLMLSSSIFTGSRSSGSIWKTQQRQGNSWEGNGKGSKRERVVRLRLRFRRPVRVWGQWYQVKILTNNCFPFLWYSDILVWLFVQPSGKKTNKYSSDILMQYVAS